MEGFIGVYLDNNTLFKEVVEEIKHRN